MTMPSSSPPRARFPLARRNLFLLGAALASLAAGYGVLLAGHASPAAVLLVLGYCVLFPLGIAL
jgi:hypothetical protein